MTPNYILCANAENNRLVANVRIGSQAASQDLIIRTAANGHKQPVDSLSVPVLVFCSHEAFKLDGKFLLNRFRAGNEFFSVLVENFDH